MALIRCYDCGKEISSLATACPSCGAPPQASTVPPPLPMRASRVKKFSLGTIALLTGVLLVLVIRGVTNQANSLSVAPSPTPATGEAIATSSPFFETASQSPTTLPSTRIPTEEATTSSPAVETAFQSSPSFTTTQTPTEATTTSSPGVETVAQDSPSLSTRETPAVSAVSEATAPPSRATYQVIGIPVSDYLNVREGAGSDYQVVTKLEPGTGDILLGTKRVAKGATTWQEITVHGQTGWVNAAYIGLETQSPASPTESSTGP